MLPDNLDAIYHSVMKRIDDQDGEYSSFAKRAITWVLYAVRTLTIAELQHALAIHDIVGTFDDGDIAPQDILTTASCGIIEIQPKSGAVRLVREYHC